MFPMASTPNRLAIPFALVAIILASAGLTIVLIAAARPPVPQFPSPQLTESLRTVSIAAIPSAICFMIYAAYSAAVSILPPSLLPHWARSRTTTPNSLVAVAILSAAALALSVASFYSGLQSIRAGGDRPLTDSQAFGSLGIGLGMASMIFSTLAVVIAGSPSTSVPRASARRR